MEIKMNGERFRVEYEGGAFCPGDRMTPPNFEPFNFIQIEWFKNDRFVDITKLFEADFIDQDEIVEYLQRRIIRLNNK